MEMKWKRNIILLYLYTFFDGFILAYVIERLFWAQRGMTITMVVATEILYGITTAAFEIPSGILADMFGRKKLLVAAACLSAAEMIILYYAWGFLPFAIAIFVVGISKAMESGSLQAIMYDSLWEGGRAASYETVYGRFRATDTFGAILAALAGAVTAYNFGYEFNYRISIGSKLAALLILLFLAETSVQRVEAPEKRKALSSYRTEITEFIRNNRILFLYCINGLALGACWIYVDEFWQLLMQAVKVPVVFFGVISVMHTAFTVPGNLLVRRLKKRVAEGVIFLWMPFLYSACFMMLGLIKSFWVIVPLAILGLWQGLMEPLLSGCIQHNAKSNVRATMESVLSFIMRLISTAVGFLFSYFADISIFWGFIALGVAAAVFGAGSLVLVKAQGKREK